MCESTGADLRQACESASSELRQAHECVSANLSQERECAVADPNQVRECATTVPSQQSYTAGTTLVQESAADLCQVPECTALSGFTQSRECATLTAVSVSAPVAVCDGSTEIRAAEKQCTLHQITHVPDIHVSRVPKEPQYHEETQEYWLPQVKIELQAAISAAVMGVRVAEIPVADSRVGESEMASLEIIPVYEDME